MALQCPRCQQPLSHPERGDSCPYCNAFFRLIPLCPQCEQPLQVLSACGAVDYFCQNGHGLVSKKTLVWQAVEEIPA